MAKNIIHKDLSYKIIGCAMEVHKQLGPGFLESVYEAAMMVELKENSIPYEVQKSFPIVYKETHLKDFVCDLVVNGQVLVELKAIRQLGDLERAQVLNYLKVTGLRLGLLVNFATRSLAYERIVL